MTQPSDSQEIEVDSPPSGRPALRVLRRSPGIAARILGRLLQVGALAAIFLVAASGGLILHLDMPRTRRVMARVTSRVLSRIFVGRFRVRGLDRLNVRGLHAKEVEVKDAAGKSVLKVSDLRVGLDGPEIVRRLLFGRQREDIIIRQVRAERVESGLHKDPKTGSPAIASVFQLRPGWQSTEPAQPRKPTDRYLRIAFPDVQIGRAWARGAVADLPTMEVVLSRVKGLVMITPKGLAIRVERFGTVVRGIGGADARGAGKVYVHVPGPIYGSFTGAIGDIGFNTYASVRGKKVKMRLRLPKATPEAVRALYTDWPLQEKLTATLDAEGTWPRLTAASTVTLGEATLAAKGPLRFTEESNADVDVTVTKLNLADIHKKAPKTSLRIETALTVWNRHDRLIVAVNGLSFPTTIQQTKVPAVDFTGDYDEKGARGTVTLHEPGLPLKIDYGVSPKGKVTAKGRVKGFQIQAVPRFKAVTRAKGWLALDSDLTLEGKDLRGTAHGAVRNFSMGRYGLAEGTLEARAQGKTDALEDLDVQIGIRGTGLDIGELKFGEASIAVLGPVTRPHVSGELSGGNAPTVKASGNVDLRGAPKVEQLQATVSRKGASVTGKVARISLTDSTVRVRNLRLSGAAGELDGELLYGPGRLKLEAKGRGLDIDELARIVGIHHPTDPSKRYVGGKVRIDANIDAHGTDADGHMTFSVANGRLGRLRGVTLRANVDVHGPEVRGDVSGLAKTLGRFGTSFHTILDGPITRLSSWRKGRGIGDLRVARVDLAAVERLALGAEPPPQQKRNATKQSPTTQPVVPPGPSRVATNDQTPVVPPGPDRAAPSAPASTKKARASSAEADDKAPRPPTSLLGNLFGRVTITRPDPNHFADVNYLVGTQGLAIQHPALRKALTHGNIDSFDVRLDGTVDGTTRYASVKATLIDVDGVFGAVSASAPLPLDQLVEEPAAAAAAASSTPVDLQVKIPGRTFRRMPPELTDQLPFLHDLAGTLSLAASVDAASVDAFLGKPVKREPVIRFELGADQLTAVASRYATPVDLKATAEYSKRSGTFQSGATVGVDDKEVALFDFRGDAPWKDLTAPRPKPGERRVPRWTGQARLKLDAVPMSVVPLLAEEQVGGTLTGSVVLTRRTGQPRVSGTLGWGAATIRDVAIGGGIVDFGAAEGHAAASVTVGDTRRRSDACPDGLCGILTATVHARTTFEERWRLNREQPLALGLHARSFEAIALQPLVASTFSRLEGRINADVSGRVHFPELPPDAPRTASSDGRAVAGGPASADGKAPADSNRPGKPLKVELDGTASFRDGLLRLTGVGAQFEGVTFDAKVTTEGALNKISVANATARSRSDEPNIFAQAAVYLRGGALTSGSVKAQIVELPLLSQGVRLGRATGRAEVILQQRPKELLVNVSIPEFVAKLPPSTGRTVQSLPENGNVVVYQPIAKPKERRESDATPLEIRINLGPDVRIERKPFEIPVAGAPVVRIANETAVSGYVNLEPGGRLPLLGKVFLIQNGRVTFDTGDPADPRIDVVAYWEGPQATIYVEVHGTASDARLTYRSSPPMADAEIIGLLLGGSTDENVVVFGAAAAALGTDTLLSNTPLSQVQFRAENNSSGNPSYVASFRVSDTVWLEGIYRRDSSLDSGSTTTATGVPSESFAGAVDWRFHRNWSLRTEGGTATAGLDLLWTYRY